MIKPRVLVVDDSPEFARMITKFLAPVHDLELIGVASSGLDAVARTKELRPDVVLMDLVLPDITGLEATKRIKSNPDAPAVIILTGHDTPEYRRESVKVEADGFIHKPEIFDKLLPLMRHLTAPAAENKP